MQVFFENALSRSPKGNLRQYAEAAVCLITFRLILTGVARSYYQKQIAQEACLRLAWEYGLEVRNDIEVENS